jgi:hypothetical protein
MVTAKERIAIRVHFVFKCRYISALFDDGLGFSVLEIVIGNMPRFCV